MKKVLITLLTLIIVLTSSMAFAYGDTDSTNIIADTLILRPLGIGALVFGSAFYVISLPIAVITDSHDRVADVLVVQPYQYVFERPVGEIGSGL